MNLRVTQCASLLSLLLAACSNSKRDATSRAEKLCPRSGTVIADARDVERDAEGVSYAAFGEYPKREPSWDRAAAVSSLLKGVWASTQEKCPAVPADSVTTISKALGKLDKTIPAQDQEGTARAGNDIHLAMANLFAYFNPDIPIEVVRMDATFLRAGVDAHFMDAAGLAADLDSMNADWHHLRGAAKAKVATCHRVGGSQTVIDDLDATLTRMTDASATSDVATLETEADAGLLEVDILELVFDCPADGEPPASGLGAKCKADKDCANGQVCDTAYTDGGRCAPDPTTTNVGAPCATTNDCGTDSRDACNNEAGDGFPGGYCAMEPCNDAQVCSPGASCVSRPFETPACLKSCEADRDCRAKEGYVCQLFVSAPPSGFGPTDHACAFPCAKDEDCTVPLKCDVSSGKCNP